MNRVAFVIGGFGFLGQSLVTHHLRAGWRVGVIDPASPADGELAFGGPGGIVTAARSVVTRESFDRLVAALGSPARVFHLGGSASVGAAAADPAADRRMTVDEMLVRERAFTDRGGKFIVPVPKVKLVP